MLYYFVVVFKLFKIHFLVIINYWAWGMCDGHKRQVRVKAPSTKYEYNRSDVV